MRREPLRNSWQGTTALRSPRNLVSGTEVQANSAGSATRKTIQRVCLASASGQRSGTDESVPLQPAWRDATRLIGAQTSDGADSQSKKATVPLKARVLTTPSGHWFVEDEELWLSGRTRPHKWTTLGAMGALDRADFGNAENANWTCSRSADSAPSHQTKKHALSEPRPNRNSVRPTSAGCSGAPRFGLRAGPMGTNNFGRVATDERK